MLNSSFIRALSILLGGITCGLVFKMDTDEEDDDVDIDSDLRIITSRSDTQSNESIHVNSDFYLTISKMYMGSFSKDILRACDLLKVDSDTQVLFFYSLLQFVTPRGSGFDASVNSSFKNNIIVTLIVSSGSINFLSSWFSRLCDNHFYNEVLVLVEEKNYKIDEGDDLWESAFSNKNELWWCTLYLLQELYSYLLFVSHDKDLFAPGRLDKDCYKSFVSFLKNFSIFIVLGGRSVSSSLVTKMKNPLFKNMLNSFQNNGRLSLKLLQQIYLRDLRMHLFDEEFWFLDSLNFDVNKVTPLLKMVENALELDLDDDDDDDDDSADIFSTQNDSRMAIKFGQHHQIDSVLILMHLPFMIPFEERADVFHHLINLDASSFMDFNSTKLYGLISRENVLFDAFESFSQATGAQFKGPLSIEFVNKFGEKEAGIDGGGLTKELLTAVVSAGFFNTEDNRSQNAGLKFFDNTTNYELYPDASYYLRLKYEQKHPELKSFPLQERSFYLQLMKFLGMIIGKCLYENVLIDVSFAPFFLSLWATHHSKSQSSFLGLRSYDTQQYRNSFDDLKGFDKELYDNLTKLISLSDEELDSLDLNFTTTEPIEVNGEQKMITLPLVPDGDNIRVKQQNKLQYIYSIAKFKLNQRIIVQSNYFLEGLFKVIKPHWLSLFNPYEIQTLISGGEKEIDIDDLKNNCELGGYSFENQTIKDLFDILREFDNVEKSKFLKFTTSSSKQPLLGFKELTPKFGIRWSGSDKSRLPTASTCVNLLKLPNYQNKQLLKEKLLYSINAEAGFDLS
ncbi:unnamed protein product [Ambrosiozyma monospora]|uniref:HECT-type E3 ubiquitin transferase n=1 Tax=Ambrosiozyma monospora TaxID=43982 RepID=A0A9W6Z071_AMBMO|nr:unnamed protein product [Ambrosiozyma monospora]